MNMLLFLIFTGLLLKAGASQIVGYGNRTADYGGEAHYRCALQNTRGVIQVTWQRQFKDEAIENLATYSARFGQQVNDPYRGKVTFTETSLSSASITLQNVTWADESCYICSFHVYPDGSQRRQTCLTVQGISEVTTAVQKEEDMRVVFSCSATGKPAPTIQWNVPSSAPGVEEPRTITVMNSDHTFTSSRNITLEVSADGSGHVDCLVNRGKRGQRQERIPFPSYTEPGPGKEPEGGGLSSTGITIVIIAVILFISCIVVAAVINRKRSKAYRNPGNVNNV